MTETEQTLLMLAPGLREFHDEETNLHFVKDKPIHVRPSVLRAYSIRNALVKGRLKVVQGEVPMSYKGTKATFKADIKPVEDAGVVPAVLPVRKYHPRKK